jgi:hypothetical protein
MTSSKNVTASSLAKSNSVVRNNTINSEPNNHFTTSNGNNIINNSSPTRTEEEDISPWLVKDSVVKRSDKSRIPLLKTVITTEL